MAQHTNNSRFRRNGARRITAGLIYAAELNQGFHGLGEGDPHPHAVKMIFNRAAPALGLTQSAVALWNRLFDYTAPKDWGQGQLPLVWPSNEHLMAELGIASINTLRSAFAQLAHHGLIEFKDSPTKQRYGRRHKNGHIDLANSFGIILSSAAMLYEHLKSKAEAYREEQKRIKGIKRAFTAARRRAEELLATIDELNLSSKTLLSAAQDVAQRLSAFYGRRPALDIQMTLSEDLELACADLEREINAAMMEQVEDQADEFNKETDSAGTNNWDPIRTIPPINPNLSKGFQEIRSEDSGQSDHIRSTGQGASFKQTLAALPFSIRKSVRDDFGYFELFDLLALYAAENGLSARRIKSLVSEVGIETACGILTVIYAKRGRIKRPDRYLEAMIERHYKAELNIGRSLFGIIAAKENGAYPDSHYLFQ